MVQDEPDFDLFVVAQDGTFSLEVVELLRGGTAKGADFLVF